MATGLACPACGALNGPDARFCERCGTKLATACRACGADLPQGAAFCPACGEAVERPHDHAAGARDERRVVSVLFVDVVGFTARTERSDPEDVRAMLRPYYARAREEIEALGGAVEKFIGDAVVGLFGAPVAHEDDPERAVRAALRVVAAVDDLNRSDPALDLAVRAAVNTGEAVVSHGSAVEGEGVVVGDAVNTASRLQGVAPENGVVVGEVTYYATRDAIDYEPLEPIELKGKAEPVPLWRAIGPRTAEPGRERPALARLVGREEEMSLLSRIWEQVVSASRPHMVTIIGPPGIGKSRLIRELEDVVDEGGRVLKGRCLSFGETTGLGAFGRQVRQAAGILDSDPSDEAVRKLEGTVASLSFGTDEAEVGDSLRVILGLPAERTPDQPEVLYAARRFVEAMALDRPTMMVFEDLHWADASLLDLLEVLSSRVREVPLLLVASTRPELLDRRPTWGGGLTAYTAVALDPLSDGEARELALELLAGSPEAHEALERVVGTGGGNPLFLEELSASMAEQAAVLSSGLPATVQAIIAARLDALPEEERRVMQDASVVGRWFWRGALLAMSPHRSPEALDRTLDSLEVRDFIRRQPTSQLAGDPEYMIKHILTREVAYGTLPRAARREGHEAVARYLESAFGEGTRESASLLAHHWQEAGHPGTAVGYLIEAAEAASRAWAKHQAIALYTEAIGLMDPAADGERIDRLRLARARVRMDLADYAAAADGDLDPLVAHAKGRLRAEALLARTRAANWMTDPEGTHRIGAEAVAAAKEIGDPEIEARALAVRAEAAAMDGTPRKGVDLLVQAMRIWPEDRRDGDFAFSLGNFALQRYWLGQYEGSLELAFTAHGHAVRVSHLASVLFAGQQVGIALAGLSRHEEAFEWFERTAAQSRDREVSIPFTARNLNMWAGTLRDVGDLDRARELNEEAQTVGERIAFPGAVVSAKIDLLGADLLESELGRAERTVPALLETSERVKGWHQWLFAGRVTTIRAELALATKRAEEAATLADQALRLARKPGRTKYAIRAQIALGRALLAMGRPGDALPHLRQAAPDATGSPHAPSAWPALAALATALEATGDDAGAERARSDLRASVETFAAGLTPAHRELLMAGPMVAALEVG